MIDLSDFQEEYKEALAAAGEFSRRAQKGIPADRWYDGSAGAKLIALGIWAQQMIMAMQCNALEAFIEAEAERGKEAMRLYTGHCKHAESADGATDG